MDTELHWFLRPTPTGLFLGGGRYMEMIEIPPISQQLGTQREEINLASLVAIHPLAPGLGE